MFTWIAIFVILAYLIGSIPTSIWVGRIFYKIDIRQHGSGNAGATNTIRILGWKTGMPVLLFDIFKGWLAVYITRFIPVNNLTEDQVIYIMIGMAFAAVLGHVFPVYAGFKGGKGVATLLGVGIALYPITVWIVLGIFIITLVLSGYVSLSSITAAVIFPFLEIFLFYQKNPGLIILAILVAVFIPVTHRKNIRRLLKGDESKFRLKRESDILIRDGEKNVKK